MTELQTIMLRRLGLEFGVDTTPAEGLEASTKQLNAETRSLQSGLKPAKKRGTP